MRFQCLARGQSRFGLARYNWRGLEHFRAYVWSAVVTHNLWVIALRKLKLKPA